MNSLILLFKLIFIFLISLRCSGCENKIGYTISVCVNWMLSFACLEKDKCLSYYVIWEKVFDRPLFFENVILMKNIEFNGEQLLTMVADDTYVLKACPGRKLPNLSCLIGNSIAVRKLTLLETKWKGKVFNRSETLHLNLTINAINLNKSKRMKREITSQNRKGKKLFFEKSREKIGRYCTKAERDEIIKGIDSKCLIYTCSSLFIFN